MGAALGLTLSPVYRVYGCVVCFCSSLLWSRASLAAEMHSSVACTVRASDYDRRGPLATSEHESLHNHWYNYPKCVCYILNRPRGMILWPEILATATVADVPYELHLRKRRSGLLGAHASCPHDGAARCEQCICHVLPVSVILVALSTMHGRSGHSIHN